MSWISDADGRLINLDRIELMEIVELEEPQLGATHMLVAEFTAGEMDSGATLAAGSEADCQRALAAIAFKVHLVKVAR